jgi:hypothetical protein
MVAERQVEKMQKFVKEYSAKMNEIEEALDESLVRAARRPSLLLSSLGLVSSPCVALSRPNLTLIRAERGLGSAC